MAIEFRPLDTAERDRLRDALKANAATGAALYAGRTDTGFLGGDGTPVDPEELRVALAIRSIPCHYDADDDGTYTIERTGKPPLRFTGELVAEATSHIRLNGGPLENRWHELALYRTAAGKLVWSVVYRSRWQGEHDHHTADVTTEAGVVSELTVEFNPLAGYSGYPAGEHYAERDRRQREAITLGYQRAVSELLGAAGIAEVVE